jgi:arginine exporter protein ArgO
LRDSASVVSPIGFTTGTGPSKGGSGGKIDTAEFLSAVGTFLATLTAFVSVGVIVLREDPRTFWTIVTMLGWVVGVIMQIIAGTIARTRT